MLQILISFAFCIDRPLLIELPSVADPCLLCNFHRSTATHQTTIQLCNSFVLHWVCPVIMFYWLSLCHCWTPLTSIDNPRNGSFVFYWVHLANMSIGYSFVIPELLWHQWKLYSQHSPHLELMETSKHSPPLTIMTKDNLLCHCCTHFDIGFLVFLISDNYPFQHISSLC